MSRARSRSRSSSSGSAQSYEDVIADAVQEEARYGVSWDHFRRGAERADRQASFRTIKQIVEAQEVLKYYVGVCKSPAHRFFKEPRPHKMRFDQPYPLLVGKGMGQVERNILEVLRKGEVQLHKLENIGPGGEGVHRRSIRFLYLCVKRVGGD